MKAVYIAALVLAVAILAWQVWVIRKTGWRPWDDD